MIELKVHCDCGQKFKFDVEPVNNQMPFAVACPICKRDGTAKANVLLKQMSIFKQVEPATTTAPAPAPIVPISIAPAPSAPAPIGTPPVPAAPGRLRINTPVHSEAAPAHGSAPPAIAPAGSAPAPISARPRMGMAAAAATGEPEQKGNFAMGLLGAFVGALVGAAIYYIIYKTTGRIIFLSYVLALGVGGLTGWLANLFGKGEGSKELGSLAAVFTIIGIIGAQYLLTMAAWHTTEDEHGDIAEAIADGGYAMSVKDAKEVVKAIPGGTDAEIRVYIAKQQTEEGQPPKPEAVSSDEVKQFRETELTNYMDLASGKLTKEEYWAKNNFDPKKAKDLMETGEKAVSGIAVIVAVFKAGIISMIVGAGLAFKLSANA